MRFFGGILILGYAYYSSVFICDSVSSAAFLSVCQNQQFLIVSGRCDYRWSLCDVTLFCAFLGFLNRDALLWWRRHPKHLGAQSRPGAQRDRHPPARCTRVTLSYPGHREPPRPSRGTTRRPLESKHVSCPLPFLEPKPAAGPAGPHGVAGARGGGRHPGRCQAAAAEGAHGLFQHPAAQLHGRD